MKKLIFFDINGTIIKRDDRTDLPFTYAVNELLSVNDAMNGIDTSARSDHDVFYEVLEKQNMSYTDSLWEEFLVLYKKQLNTFWTSDVWRENVDVVSFIKQLSSQGHYLALITGELSIGAEYKLKKIGVWQYFMTGGFGEDGLKRFDIADQAVLKAKTVFPDDYSEIVVIGDTTLDIKTARHINAKVISITTGSHSRETLEVFNPDYLIDTFSEVVDLFKH